MSAKTSLPEPRGVPVCFPALAAVPGPGRKIWAKEYGLKAWRIPVLDDEH